MKSTAISVYQQKRTEVREGRFQPPAIKRCSCTVNELLDDYLESCMARQIRDPRILSGRLRIWREAIGKKSARMVSVGDIESALLKYANGKPLGPNHTRRAEKRAPATVKRALIALKSCFPGEKTGSHRTDLPLHWEDYLEEAGIEDFRWHDLRHTTASRLAMSGVDLYTIAKILGHSDLSMTVRYAHLAPGYLQEAMKKLAGYAHSKTDTKTGTNEE
jgi:Phage integrase family